MRLRFKLVVIGAGITALAWAFTGIRDAQLRSQREIDRLNTVVVEVRGELQQRAAARITTGTDPDRYTSRRVAPLARAEARDQLPVTLTESDPGDEAQLPHTPALTFEDSRQRVLSAFAAEAVDASWSPDAERKLESIVRSHLPAGSRLVSVACRSSMCEVQLTHADTRAQADFLRTGFHDWPGSLFVTEKQQEHGEVAVTIVAAREGSEPPIAPH